MKISSIIPTKAVIVSAVIIIAITITAFRIETTKDTEPTTLAGNDAQRDAYDDEYNGLGNSEGKTPARKTHGTDTRIDSATSVTAFGEVYKVLMSPRCMNCHPAGDVPLQGDDSHIHQMLPQRGKDGKGVTAMKCSNCHQPTNIPGEHTPPGNPKWALPPADMKMIFEGKSARELALQIMDFKQNGHKNREKLIEHARDTLVKAGWDMGEGRKPPPLSYEEFVVAWDTWINTGGVAPAK